MVFVYKYFDGSIIVKDLFSTINVDRPHNQTVYIQLNK